MIHKDNEDIGFMDHMIFNWLRENVGKTFKSLKPRAKDIQILVVDDYSGTVRLKFIGGVIALPLYFWMFERTIKYLVIKNCAVRIGAKVAPPFDDDTIEGQIWLKPHPKPPGTPFKAAPHVCDLLVHAGFGKYEDVINLSTNRKVQGIRYMFSNTGNEPNITNNPHPTPKTDKEKFADTYLNVIIQWTEENKSRIVDSRRSYRWKGKTTQECINERNEISKQIILSRIKNQGGIDLITLDKITKWGFNREFPFRETDKVLDSTRKAFTLLDNGNLIDATKTLLSITGVGISRASKILGLSDQDNLCIYDSRVGEALRDLTFEGVKLVLCPPGRNRPGDFVSNSWVWAKHYQHLIWTLEIVRDYLNDIGYTLRIADVEMALFIMGKIQRQPNGHISTNSDAIEKFEEILNPEQLRPSFPKYARILSDCVNRVIVQVPGRSFPGVVLQGDQLFQLVEMAKHSSNQTLYKVLLNLYNDLSNVPDKTTKIQVTEILKGKFKEIGRVVSIPKQKGGSFSVELAEDGVNVDNLGSQPFLPWVVFEEAVWVMRLNGGRAQFGKAMSVRLGEPDLPYDSIEGHIASQVYGKRHGDSVFRRIVPISNILIWSGICKTVTGELILTETIDPEMNK
jgi:hypothetical protein